MRKEMAEAVNYDEWRDAARQLEKELRPVDDDPTVFQSTRTERQVACV